MTKKERIIVFGIGAVLLAIFTFTDLAISQTLFTKNLYGRIFEVIGELPFVFLSTVAAVLLFRFRSKKNSVVNILLAVLYGILVFLIMSMGGFMTTNYLSENLQRKLPAAVPVFISLVILAGAVFAASRVKEEKRKEAITYAVTAILYFIAIIIVMNSIKTVWGRMRMREMTDPVMQFTRWYVITDRGGFNNIYASFPSGHTMNSAAVILLTLFPTFMPGFEGKERMTKTVAYVWILVVGISRVVMGAHFASDVTVGALLSLILFDCISRIICKVRG